MSTAPAEIADLIRRLRGEYRIPIGDGLGPVGGDEPENANEFVRNFGTSPIKQKAAATIDALCAERDAAIARAEAADAERDEARSKAKDEAAEFIFGVLEEALGNPAYNPCDGTETWDGDVAGTVYRLLNASGVRNEDTGELATTRAEAAEAQVAKLREALADAASALAKAASAYRSNAVVLTYKDVVSKIDTAALRARAALAGKEPAHD